MINLEELVFELMLNADLAKQRPLQLNTEFVDYLYDNYSSSEMALIKDNYQILPEEVANYLIKQICILKLIKI